MTMSYDIIRINQIEMTITVLLKIDDRTLQEDVPVTNFTDMQLIDSAVNTRLHKFMQDLEDKKAKENLPVNPELQALVDKYTQSFKEEEQPN